MDYRFTIFKIEEIKSVIRFSVLQPFLRFPMEVAVLHSSALPLGFCRNFHAEQIAKTCDIWLGIVRNDQLLKPATNLKSQLLFQAHLVKLLSVKFKYIILSSLLIINLLIISLHYSYILYVVKVLIPCLVEDNKKCSTHKWNNIHCYDKSHKKNALFLQCQVCSNHLGACSVCCIQNLTE